MVESTPVRKQTALVTGASGGIGLELARELARHGSDLVMVARSADKLEKLAESLRAQHGVKVLCVPKDLSAAGSPRQVFDELTSRGVTVDVLVNNAGFGAWGPFAEADWPGQKEMLDVNITALVQLTRLFLPGMIERHGGSILNVGSTGSFVPTPTMAVYSATKAFVLSFSLALSEELRGTGVTVTVLCPGNTATGFASRARSEGSRLVRSGQMSAEEVARIGYRAMERGKRKTIAGFSNKLMMGTARFSPTGMVLGITRRLMSRIDAR